MSRSSSETHRMLFFLLAAITIVALAGCGHSNPTSSQTQSGTAVVQVPVASSSSRATGPSTIGTETGSFVALKRASGIPDSRFPQVQGGNVYAMAADGAGGYYIGGNFTAVVGISRSRIAHIRADGSLDRVFNPAANGTVYALAVSGSTVYAGGDFTSIGRQSRSRIAALRTSDGLATTWNPHADSTVDAFAISGGTVYAGGKFNTIGGQRRYRLAALQAGSGAATPWNPAPDGPVDTLAVSGATVYAGGGFTTIAGVRRFFIAALVRIPRKPNARSTASRTLIPLQAERLGAKRRVCLAKVDVLFGFRSTRSPSPGFCDAAIHH